jgi:Mg/Co/Ni transporter MgtE
MNKKINDKPVTQSDLKAALKGFRETDLKDALREFRETDLKDAFKEFKENDLKDAFKEFRENDLKDAFNEFTETVFKKEINRLDTKIDNVALSLLRTQSDVEYLKENVATKHHIRAIMDKIDAFIGKNREIDQEQLAQGLHIKELKETTRQHDVRITALEAIRLT